MSCNVFWELKFYVTGPPSPLPSGIVIRTPSPVSGPSTLPNRSAQPTGEVVATRFKQTTQEIKLKRSFDTMPTAHMVIGDGDWRSLAQKAISVYQDCATTIPWLDLHEALQRGFLPISPQERLNMLTYIGIPQTSSTAHMWLGVLMVTCIKSRLSRLLRSSQALSHNFRIMSRTSIFNPALPCSQQVTRFHLAHRMILDAESRDLRHALSSASLFLQ